MIMLTIWMYWKFRRKNESESENADFSTTLPRTLAVPEEKKPLHVVYSLLQVVCVWGGDVSFIFFKPNTFVYHAYIYCDTDCLLWWSYLHKENIPIWACRGRRSNSCPLVEYFKPVLGHYAAQTSRHCGWRVSWENELHLSYIFIFLVNFWCLTLCF